MAGSGQLLMLALAALLAQRCLAFSVCVVGLPNAHAHRPRRQCEPVWVQDGTNDGLPVPFCSVGYDPGLVSYNNVEGGLPASGSSPQRWLCHAVGKFTSCVLLDSACCCTARSGVVPQCGL